MTFLPEVTDRSTLVLAFLDSLERAEATLLAWGVVDGGFAEDELEARAEQFLEKYPGARYEAGDFIRELRERRLLFDLPLGTKRVSRTRMAEAVRLLARLRQMFRFPQWRRAPSLVSDFRFTLRPRTYPARDVPVEVALSTLDAAGVLMPSRRKALEALLSRPGLIGLAGFQVRAIERVFRDLESSWTRGMIVTVGTGSGKTLAFYLPALAHLSTLITTDEHWTKAIALYPRTELLKDQFSEAYQEARRLDALLQLQGRRKLTIGAFFGLTPNKAALPDIQKKWEHIAAGFVCPYLRCPAPNCGGVLVWSLMDLQQRRERLSCATCHREIGGDEVLLTRARMRLQPPDVLFTTTEMLNRVMTDEWSWHVFGLRVPKPPRLVLLDEVHTYTGVHGAHVAMLLRRWRHAVRDHVQFTGLSATLRNASELFAQLVGLPLGGVQEITPSAVELQREGMEYLLALRGDPVSKTSLLSTTIQATMLLRRVLDPRPERGADLGPSLGAYGRKVFVFTDDLDVTNRLYHNLLDAEGLNSQGHARAGRVPLAALRARGHPDPIARLIAGQSWYLCEEIGHPEGLAVPLRIGRTSSQDTGVDRAGDAIVATASLEVGYNDPEVGAVVQHKVPHNSAAFLQRKGRAGRIRSMRPWTVVVLSDFGRDRLAFQGYEMLFDPTLDPHSLPVLNRYVLRMQAVYAFMEWMAQQLPPGTPKGIIYYDFAGPATGKASRLRQQREAAVIRQLLVGSSGLEASLTRYLTRALRLGAAAVTAVLWDPPRSLMLQVLPTLLRRLESGWRRIRLNPAEGDEDYRTAEPLPDFIPASLFGDLNLPEVLVVTPAPQTRQDALPVVQALRTLAPGRVTRRFAVGSGSVSHWIQPPILAEGTAHQKMDVEAICAEFEEVGQFEFVGDDGVASVRCVRPWLFRPSVVPKEIQLTSNATLVWRTQFLKHHTPVELDLPEGSEWAAIILSIQLYSHAYQSHVEARRFAIGSQAAISRKRGSDLETAIQFVDRATGQQSSIGFAVHVDGLHLQLRMPTSLVHPDDPNRAKVRGFRAAYFRHRVLTDDTLAEHANVFRREWLYQVYFSALSAYAVAQDTTLRVANDALLGDLAEHAAEKVLKVIFESIEAAYISEADEIPDGPDAGTDRPGKLTTEVLRLFRESAVLDRLHALAQVLWGPPDGEWLAWARQRYLATLGGAVVNACAQLYPEAATDELLVDIDPGHRTEPHVLALEERGELWITEATLGGGGVLEEVARRYTEDPRRFFRLLEGALGPSDYELIDAELRRILDMLPTDAALAAVLEQVRTADEHAALTTAVGTLEAALAERGILVTRAVMSAVHARILRPGSSAQTDAVLHQLVRRWRSEEERLGVELDARVFAYLASKDTGLDTALNHIEPGVTADPVFRFHTIYGLLWPRGNVVRSVGITTYNPYAPLPDADRMLVLDHLPQTAPEVSLGRPTWRIEVAGALRTHGAARLVAGVDARAALRAALLDLAASPLEVDFLHLYPQVESVERVPEGFVVRLHLLEAIQ